MLYDYKCPNCEHEGEVLTSIADSHSQHCPKCDTVMTKLVSTPAFMFKEHGGTDSGRIMQIAKKR